MTANSTLVLMLVMALAGPAHADDEGEARAHYQRGRVQYNLGDYEGAVREFSAGYRLAPRPQFLVNLGQAWRRLGQLERAREMYQRFLADAPEGDRARPEVRELIAEVERELSRSRLGSEAARPAPRGTLPRYEEGSPEGALAARPNAGSDAASPARADAGDPGPRRSGWLRFWWALPVAAVALAGAGIGIYFLARPPGGGEPDCAAAAFGCLDLRR